MDFLSFINADNILVEFEVGIEFEEIDQNVQETTLADGYILRFFERNVVF